MEYLTLTNENITSMKKDEFNLITAPTGNGKTTAIIRDLGAFCAANNKTILYLVPRKSLEEKLNYKYHYIKDKLIKFRTYQWLGEYLNHTFTEHYDFVIFDECHTLLTSACFDFNCYKLMNYMNKTTNITFVGLTATPDPLEFMLKWGYMKKKINPIDVETYDNSTKGEIYLVRNKEDLLKVHKKALDDGYKVINFKNDVYTMNEFKEEEYEDYKCASIISKSNELALQYKSFENDAAYNSIIENEVMTVDHLTTTTVLELGVSIKQTHNFLISFEGNYMPYTIEQAKSRIRATDENLNVDMVFLIKTKYSPKLKCDDISVNMNKQLKDNDLAYLSLAYQFNFYNNQFYFDSTQAVFYELMLSRMYPNKEIIVLESWNLYDVQSVIEEEYLLGMDSVDLLPDEIEKFKEQLKALKLDKKNPNRKVGKKRLNDYLLENNIPYVITNGKPYIDPVTKKRESTWIIMRLVA